MHMTENEQQEFLSLLEPLYSRVERYALSLCRDRVAARELLCDTVSMAYEGFEGLKNKQAFLSYLFSIANRQWRRRQQQFRRLDYVPVDEIDELYAGGAQPDQCLELSELYQALDRLHPEYRDILLLAEIVGLSHKEIQDVTGLNIATIKVRVFRAKLKLKALLADESPPQSNTDRTSSHPRRKRIQNEAEKTDEADVKGEAGREVRSMETLTLVGPH